MTELVDTEFADIDFKAFFSLKFFVSPTFYELLWFETFTVKCSVEVNNRQNEI